MTAQGVGFVHYHGGHAIWKTDFVWPMCRAAAVSEQHADYVDARTCKVSSDGWAKTGVRSRSRHDAAGSRSTAGTGRCGSFTREWGECLSESKLWPGEDVVFVDGGVSLPPCTHREWILTSKPFCCLGRHRQAVSPPMTGVTDSRWSVSFGYSWGQKSRKHTMAASPREIEWKASSNRECRPSFVEGDGGCRVEVGVSDCAQRVPSFDRIGSARPFLVRVSVSL